MTANSIHLRVPSNEKNTEKTLDNKKGDKLTDNDRAFGHWPLLCNDLGVCSGRQKQTFGKWTHKVGHNSSVSVLNTDCNGIRHVSKTNGVTERWIFIIKSIHWCATVPTTFAVVLKSRLPIDLKSQQKTRERPPIKRWESGLLRLYIAPVSAYLRWYDAYNVYRRRT